MNNHLLKAVLFTAATTIGIFLGFYFLSDSAEHLAMICFVSIAGYMSAIREYLDYKQSKKVTRWEQ